MKILKTDKITYKVQTRTEKFIFTKLSVAIECLNKLNEIAYLNFDASSLNSSVSASLMKKNKELQIEIIHQHYLDQLINRKAI